MCAFESEFNQVEGDISMPSNKSIRIRTNFDPEQVVSSTKVIPVPEGEDHRAEARYHVKMIMGNRHVRIVDTDAKYKPAVRSLKLDISPEIIKEDNYREIFLTVVVALHETGQIAADESAACVTFPAGTIEVEMPVGGQA
jgi:hypothetical protein